MLGATVPEASLLPLWLALLAACGPRETPTPPPPPTPVEEPPAPAPEDDAEVLWEVVVRVDERSATGMRLRDDGDVELAVGAPHDLHWTRERRVGYPDFDEAKALLASEAVARIPDRLPRPGNAPAGGPSAVWKVRTADGVRTIVAESYLGLRVPEFARLEQLLRAGRRLPAYRTVWTVREGGREVVHEVPCDPADVPALAPLVQALHDPAVPKREAATTAAPVLLRVDWGVGTRAWQTRLHEDGVVVRLDERGRTHVGQLRRSGIVGLGEALQALDWAEVACP